METDEAILLRLLFFALDSFLAILSNNLFEKLSPRPPRSSFYSLGLPFWRQMTQKCPGNDPGNEVFQELIHAVSFTLNW